MFWDKKKSGALPDLPPSTSNERASISDYQKNSEMQDNLGEVHELPSFPDSPMQKGFSQSAIKDAIENEEVESSEDHHPMTRTTELPEPEATHYSASEMDEWSPSKLSSAVTYYPRSMRSQMSRQIPDKPVFVRLDKFQTARNSLDLIRQKLNEAEDLLKRIREVKLREDQELVLWEKEMENVKSRIRNVLADIFEKTESY